jgi:hypothetical protein
MRLRTNISVLDLETTALIGEIEVTLSRRNLLALLHKLDWEDSAHTICKRQDGILLTVMATDNEEHYGDGEFGIMHPETERFIGSYGGSE